MKRNSIFLSSIIVFILIIISFSFSDTCNFPFPQNINYPYGIKPNNFTNAQMDQHCLDWFNKWKAYYVTQNNCTGSEWRVQRTVTGNGITNGCYGFATAPAENDTVSEAIGYGMVIMVFMSSATNNTQQYFNGFYTYYKDHLDGAGLMNWQIPYCNSGGSATDADEDVAFALLAADKQWGSAGAINYKSEANTIIGRILSNEITAANDIRPGDGWDGANISYFAPYEYRMFGDYTGTSQWYSVASHTYQTIVNYYSSNSQTVNAALGMDTGLMPNWCNYDGTTWSPGAWSMDPNSWWWDAIRHAWRQSYDYLLYGTMNSPLAYSNNNKISTFFQTKYNGDATKILSHYTLDGTETQYNRGDRTPDLGTEDVRNLPGPEGAVAISAMVEGDQNWLNECYYDLVTMDAGTGSGGLTNTGVLWGTDYFCDILKMQYLLILTGNMPNPMGNYPTPTPTNTWNVLTPTPTPSPTPIRGMFDDFETGNIINLDTSAGGQTAFTSVVNTTNRPAALTGGGLRDLQITSTANGWGAYGEDSPYTGGLGYLDETGATALSFYIYPTVALSGNFFVKLVEATANGADGETYSNRITESTNSAPANTWTKITIAITNTSVFSRDQYNTVNGDGVLDLSGIKSFYLQVDSAPNATIYIDNIQFTGNFPTVTPTSTVTKTRTPNGTPTNSPTITVTATNTLYYSPTITPTWSSTQTNTPYISPTITQTSTITPTFTLTPYIPFGVFDDFETGVFKNLNTTDTGGGSTVAVTNVTTTVHAGTHSMQVVTTGTAGWAVVTIDSPYDGGLGYRNFTGATALNFWIDAPAGTVLFVKVVETNGQQWSDRNVPITVPASGWQDINVALSSLTVDQYSPTGDGDDVLDLNIIQSVTFQWNNPGNMTMYIDDIKFTGMPTPTMTQTSTKTATFTPTMTPSATDTPTFTLTQTPAFTKTYTPSITPTYSFTVPATITFTQTATPTTTFTYTGTPTFTATSTPTFTFTMTVTQTRTVSPTITISPTGTPPTQTVTPTVTATSSATLSVTPSFTRTFTGTFTMTATPSFTPTYTQTSTATFTFTQTLFVTPSITPSVTATMTGTPPTATFTSTVTQTAANTYTFTMTFTGTATQTMTPTMTFTCTFTPQAVPSAVLTFTATPTLTPGNNGGTKTVIFPNPYNPAAGGKLGISFYTEDTYSEIQFKVYTCSYRLVYYGTQSGSFKGQTEADMDAGGFTKFANGVYFYAVSGTNTGGQQKKFSTGVLDIIK
jgi:endo-1,4-beta-D-glucanase Y